MARRTGYTLAHISRIFNGKRTPSLRAAGKIARALGVSVDELAEQLPVRTSSK